MRVIQCCVINIVPCRKRHDNCLLRVMRNKNSCNLSWSYSLLLEVADFYGLLFATENREMPKQNQSKNKYYHITSRGGYEHVKAKWNENKVQEKWEQENDSDLLIEHPSPPRHELWNTHRLRPMGSFVYDVSASLIIRL